MFRLSAIKISLAASALMLCAGFAQAQTMPASPLTASPTSVGIGYSGTPGAAQFTALTVTTGSAPFVIDPSTVPFWLATQNSSAAALTSGTVTAGTPTDVYFQATTAAGSLPEGASVAYVGFAVNGYSELTVQVTLTVTGSASTLSVLNGSTTVTSSGAAVNVPWTYGSAAPTLNLTVLSSGAPITFSAKSTVVNSPTEDWIVLPSPSGVAYDYGGSLEANFALDALTNSTVGSVLTGAITITYGSGTFVVNITVTVGEPASTVTSIFPRETAPLSAPQTTGTATSGSATLTVASGTGIAVGQLVTGTGIFAGTTVSAVTGTAVTLSHVTTAALTAAPVSFVSLLTVVATGTGFGNDATTPYTPTTVSLTYGAAGNTVTTVLGTSPLASGSATYVNPTTMVLTIPSADSNGVGILPTSGQDVVLTITNGATYNTTAATIPLYVTTNPIINSVVDAAALVEPATGAIQNVAPYEMISIFGNNFCPTCTTPVVAPVSSDRYPASLNAPASNGYGLSVTFFKADGVTVVGSADILFANDTQINALVPSTVVAADNPMQVVVTYNSVASNMNLTYSANAAAANPGIFTTSSTGQGQGAILNSNGTVNNSTNEAPAASTVMIYLSGLGTPTSTAADTAATAAPKYPASCISIANFVAKAGLTNPSTADGAILNPADILTNLFPPCMTAPAVTIGGKTAAVTYAGWVSDSVAGLYQINATVPSGLTAGNYPVVVTVTTTVGTAKVSTSSQAGVTVAVN
jgi:uncharacterized protein (TIGR03437 family)